MMVLLFSVQCLQILCSWICTVFRSCNKIWIELMAWTNLSYSKLIGKVFNISLLITMLTIGFCGHSFWDERGSLLFLFVEIIFFFIMNWCSILSNAFSASMKMIAWFLSFILLMWSVIIIDFSCVGNCLMPLEYTSLSHEVLYIAGFDLVMFVQVLCIYSQERNWHVIFLPCNALANYYLMRNTHKKRSVPF